MTAALDQYKSSLKIKERLKDKRGIASSRHGIGMIYQEKGELNAALKEFKASLEILERIGDEHGIALSRHQIGMIYQEKGELDAALNEYRESLETKERLGDLPGICASYGQIGLLYIELMEYSNAFEMSFRALLVVSKIGGPRLAQIIKQLAGIRIEWDPTEFDKAWKEHTGEDVPEAIIKASEEMDKSE